MKKLLPVFMMAASLHAADHWTGQDYRHWNEDFRRTYVGAFLDGYAHSRLFAQKEVTRLLFDNLRETTRQMLASDARAAKEKGVGENWGALCLPREIALAQHTDTLNLIQLTAVLDKYIADHPERWDKEIGDLAEEAFTDACEKRAKNP